MTPAERQEWERLVDELVNRERRLWEKQNGGLKDECLVAQFQLANTARAALDAFVERLTEAHALALAERVALVATRHEAARQERLTAGEEVVRVVNPEYPGDKHYWAANNVPTFPVSYVITPGTFRVTRVEEGTDG